MGWGFGLVEISRPSSKSLKKRKTKPRNIQSPSCRCLSLSFGLHSPVSLSTSQEVATANMGREGDLGIPRLGHGARDRGGLGDPKAGAWGEG